MIKNKIIMEKKIERVPYISKWYKEGQKDELLHFDFGIDSTTTTIGTNEVNYIKNDAPILEYVCYLTEHDIYDLKIRLCSIREYLNLYLQGKFNWNQTVEKSYRNINDVIDYLENKNGIRDQCQKNQLDRLIEKQNQKPYGTLCEHWKELMDLFRMNGEGVDLKEYVDFYKLPGEKEKKNKCYHAFQDSSISSEQRHKNDLILTNITKSLGIEFIEDFVKACEKCEELNNN